VWGGKLMSEYQLNILVFTLLRNYIDVSFSAVEKEGYIRIYKGNLPSNLPKEFIDSTDKYIWWSLTNCNSDTSVLVDLKQNTRFAKYIFNKYLYDHFFE
jgi:fibronectin type 3 domain-containing protein